MEQQHVKQQHHRPGAGWALLAAVLLLVSVTAFTAGRAFSTYGAPTSPNMELSRTRFAFVWQKASESSSWSSLKDDRPYTVKYANSNVTEHPACAFFRAGKMMCYVIKLITTKKPGTDALQVYSR